MEMGGMQSVKLIELSAAMSCVDGVLCYVVFNTVRVVIIIIKQ
jgi:hypothetical protein